MFAVPQQGSVNYGAAASGNRKLQAAEIDRVVKLYAAGWSVAAIARDYQMYVKTV